MTPDNDEAAPRHTEVADLLRRSGRTQDEVAAYLTRRLGRPFKHYHVSRMLLLQRKVASDEMDALRELAGQPATAAPVGPELTETADVVPLFGYANGAGSTLHISSDARVGVVPAHPAQHGSRSAFAFICFGDSVSPRLNHGEIGYAIRNRTPFRGQLCVVETSDGNAIVKFFERQDEHTLFLSQLQPKSELKVALREVVAIHAVVGSTFGPG